jgi:4-diphosphocytidyl-2-C-methyl-D-erythritol kinase
MATELRSFSKINVGLAIGPARPDGFHSLATLYQTLDACDLVRVSAAPAPHTRIRLTTNDSRVPTDARNTAWRMAERALAALRITAQVDLHIEKRLPVQGGLGAGSANAIAALRGLELELGRQLSAPDRLRLAAEIGSDVPLFLLGGPVLGLGRGEQVFPLPDFPATDCVLATPEIAVSTPQAFRDWDARHAPDPLTPGQPPATLDRLSRLIAAAWSEPYSSGVLPPRSPNHAAESEQDLAGNPLSALVRTGIDHCGLVNDFEEVVFPQHPLLGEIKRLLAGTGCPAEHRALFASLSGSGSALFGLYRTPEAAALAIARLADRGIPALRTRTLPRAAYWQTMVVR